MATMVSPGLRPALAAGLRSGSAQPGLPWVHRWPEAVTGVLQVAVAAAPAGSTQAGTSRIVVLTTPVPTAVSVMAKNTTARIRLWKGPANITMTRCHQGLA